MAIAALPLSRGLSRALRGCHGPSAGANTLAGSARSPRVLCCLRLLRSVHLLGRLYDVLCNLLGLPRLLGLLRLPGLPSSLSPQSPRLSRKISADARRLQLRSPVA